MIKVLCKNLRNFSQYRLIHINHDVPLLQATLYSRYDEVAELETIVTTSRRSRTRKSDNATTVAFHHRGMLLLCDKTFTPRSTGVSVYSDMHFEKHFDSLIRYTEKRVVLYVGN